MHILLIGGTGTIGKRVSDELKKKHRVTIVGHKQGQYQVDLAKAESIQRLYSQVDPPDAVVCIAGEAKWGNFQDLTEADFLESCQNKLLGQISLVRYGLEKLSPGGSFTLSSGILADHPVVGTSAAALVNGGLHSFVQALALELKDQKRINVVSLNLVEDSQEKYQDYFPGYDAIPMQRAVNGYIRSIEGRINGQVIRVY
ncbi:short chain dehydrogenase [bacterium (Candidatus Blackallbacteria) CG17_big_fil_post_rev_8_21_14_2_50_48_46]|uniref:Short chain dehydrogenase n=1 Tax=bacterium (Candidatus Blackallbacteria) CG17_big_fil_post_rev_8_21_14_2_50_48_46 TaxID=2014261 RepID=A0A2M7G1X6_9BACT|nr:MAG: short chain dehydrogenase [bacterium (Candidatus Blackallbacteria) CG18_big_fil_WC_8_21_14_2_50_49_26]PIW15764.1 MAG: short chain dehydrogenase [bacterium (Candidatus Blackallbacteria) CG17_big_fil_post_rev_8_21_14_2_50_48_46]PIW48738.1 MAG: short chain dehydrogenase [bacterium (Candidatus Blackallbacteria) CG13_big_fil_rev_8_21_14_2_50_49_14]